MTTATELMGRADPTGDGFRITVSKLRRPSPPQFYEGLMVLCGMQNVAPAPHEVDAVQIEATGTAVHVELRLVDGRLAVADVELDTRIRGLL